MDYGLHGVRMHVLLEIDELNTFILHDTVYVYLVRTSCVCLFFSSLRTSSRKRLEVPGIILYATSFFVRTQSCNIESKKQCQINRLSNELHGTERETL